jgi:hypothetical protein
MDVVARLAELCRLIDAPNGGKLFAFEDLPQVIHTASLPACLIFPSQATHQYVSETIVEATEDYRIQVLLNAGWAGTATQAQNQYQALIDNVRQFFWARTGLEISTSAEVVEDAKLISHTGYIILRYPDGSVTGGVGDFSGVEFLIRVIQYHKINRYNI